MGEAWSDYYAMDYLVTKGFLKDTSEVRASCSRASTSLAGRAPDPDRWRSTARSGATAAGLHVRLRPGGQGRLHLRRLPDHRRRPRGARQRRDLGPDAVGPPHRARSQRRRHPDHPRRCRSRPSDPDLLDMRNAILQADLVAYGGKHADAIWQIFANRGMGFFAGSIDSADASPARTSTCRRRRARRTTASWPAP